MSPAVGVPIYFRTSQQANVAPPPIDFKSAHHNVVVLLVDSSMVLDEAYRRFAQDLAQAATEPHNRLLAFQFPGTGRLPLQHLQQTMLPQDEAERTAKLRLIFASECCRLLQQRPRGGEGGARLSPEPPQLFISYAKRDAAEQAEDLKALVEQMHVDTFFDKVDIAPGYDFTCEIRESIKRSVVLAWQSDEYASRPWCNIELLTAKEALRPIVVVLGVKVGEERSFPYLGNVRTIVATGGNSTDIIIAAVREYLRKLYAEGRFTSLLDAGLIPPAHFHLFRPPEPIDGALLEQKTQAAGSDEAPTAPAREQRKEWVFYPDPPLCTAELDVLARLFPHIQFVTPATLDRSSLNGMRIALSISEAKDLGHFGVSPLHLVSTMVEVARHALCHGAVIAYGGDLRERRQYGFTRQLFELVHAYTDLGRQRLERICNFLAYHIAAELPRDEESRLIELATFVKPLPQNVADRFQLDLDRRQTIPDDTPAHRYIRARCLTAMREAMCRETDARIIIGGRVSGHQGKYPGLFEEAYLTLCAGKPLYLVGGFGGCARLLIQMICDKQRPVELTRDYQRAHPRMARYPGADGSDQQEMVPFEQLEHSYLRYEQEPEIGQERIDYDSCVDEFLSASIMDLKNGLTEEENRDLFETSELDRIVYLLMKGLAEVFKSGFQEQRALNLR
jgi:SLOG cluster2/TIR domain